MTQLQDFQSGAPVYSGNPTSVPNVDGSVTPISEPPGVATATTSQPADQMTQQVPANLSSILGYAPLEASEAPPANGSAGIPSNMSSILGYADPHDTPQQQPAAPQPLAPQQPQQPPAADPYQPDQFYLREAGYIDAIRQMQAEREYLKPVEQALRSNPQLYEQLLAGALGTPSASAPPQGPAAPPSGYGHPQPPDSQGGMDPYAVAEVLQQMGIIPALQSIQEKLQQSEHEKVMDNLNNQAVRLKNQWGDMFDPKAMAFYGAQRGFKDLETSFYHWYGQKQAEQAQQQYQRQYAQQYAQQYARQYAPQMYAPQQGYPQAPPQNRVPVTAPTARMPGMRPQAVPSTRPANYDDAQTAALRMLGLPT